MVWFLCFSRSRTLRKNNSWNCFVISFGDLTNTSYVLKTQNFNLLETLVVLKEDNYTTKATHKATQIKYPKQITKNMNTIANKMTLKTEGELNIGSSLLLF